MDEELYMLTSDDSEMTLSQMMILEGTENKRPGVLCEVEGPFIVLDKENNNERWYTHSLIETRILNIPYTQKMLENRTLYGEASHPADRFDVLLPLISHNITRLWFNQDKTILMGRADVLDTPSGNIIYTLIKYGSKIGISVRARGRLIKKGNKRIPDESVYQFKTFDFVPNPGFDEARMNRVDESVEDDLPTSFMNYVKGASLPELSCIQPLFESANDELFGDVKKVINSRMSDNTLKSTNDKDLTDILYEDAVKNEEKLLALEEQIEDLMSQIDAALKDKEVLNEEVETLKKDISQKAEDMDGMVIRLTQLCESESYYQSENEKLNSRIDTLIDKVQYYRGRGEEAELALERTVERLNEAEQERDLLDKEHFRALEKLYEAQELVEDLTEKPVIVKEVQKKKILPQGKTQVLNESVVNTPVVIEEAGGDSRRMNFIRKCSI